MDPYELKITLNSLTENEELSKRFLDVLMMENEYLSFSIAYNGDYRKDRAEGVLYRKNLSVHCSTKKLRTITVHSYPDDDSIEVEIFPFFMNNNGMERLRQTVKQIEAELDIAEACLKNFRKIFSEFFPKLVREEAEETYGSSEPG